MSAEQDLKKLKCKRGSIKGKLTAFQNFLQKSASEPQLSELQIAELQLRFDKIMPIFDEFDALQTDIEMVLAAASEGDVGEERQLFEDAYYASMSSAQVLIQKHTAKRNSGANESEVSSASTVVKLHNANFVNLPKIDLPRFEGGYHNWLAFRDTYLSLIHNNDSINTINKFHYLRASLKGSAALVIQSLDLTNDNYSIAWQLLSDRYDNQKLLVTNHVNALFNVEPIHRESSQALRNILDVTNKNLRALQSLGQPTDNWDTLIVHMMANKLDSVTTREWEERRNLESTVPSLEVFKSFLLQRADFLESLEDIRQNKLKHESSSFSHGSSKSKSLVATTSFDAGRKKSYSHQCPLCKKAHNLYNYFAYRKLPVEARLQKAKAFKVCLNCLCHGHSEEQCRLSNCKYCNKKHNTLIHTEPAQEAGPAADVPLNIAVVAGQSTSNITSNHVLLSTALVKVMDSKGKLQTARILLDNGSTTNFITHDLCSKLKIQASSINSKVTGINSHISSSSLACTIQIHSVDGGFKADINCYILPNITTAIPSTYIHIHDIQMPQGVQLADPTFNKPACIDILVGAELFWSILGSNRIQLGKNQPTLCESRLGWLVTGGIAQPKPHTSICMLSLESPSDTSVDILRFRELGTVAPKHKMTSEENACDEHHRVSEIQELTVDHQVRYYVPSKHNPSNLVSRGLSADQLGQTSWWSDPQFIHQDESQWPKSPNKDSFVDLPEKIEKSFVPQEQSENMFTKLIQDSSSFTKLKRIMAFVFRFINNCCKDKSKQLGNLSIQELENSSNFLLRRAQKDSFPKELDLLTANKPLPRKCNLQSLSPFLGNDKLIRVGGRLSNSCYGYDVKHPILLSSKHHLCKLIFRMYHIMHMHSGPQLLLATTRHKYWAIRGRDLARSTVHKCVKCSRFSGKTIQPVMGNLPKERVELEYQFLETGVDYAGPVMISNRKGRGSTLVKSYICAFVCLATKAVHLELVTDLTKEAYIAALSRFIARRGKPQTIFSDNATTFQGTCNEFTRLVSQASSAEVMQGIKFSFIPAYAPHFGGLWESAIKSIKHHLRRVLDQTHMTYEEMSTLLIQIEAILNSRPLTPLSNDPNDLYPLTPAHFLIGRSINFVPHPQIQASRVGALQRWKRIELLKQQFWNRFSNEYILWLQQKTKWHNSAGTLQEGFLVVIKDKMLPPLLWQLGRVIRVIPGADGVARVADIKTKKGVIRRAFNNICPLPVANN